MVIPIAGGTRQIICGGMSYAAHNEELKQWIRIEDEIKGRPFYFVKALRSVIPDNAPIVLPDISGLTSRSLDAPYGQITGEVELGIVLKDPVRCIPPEQVRRHVLGYTIFNDITQRDLEVAGYPISLAKGFRTFGPIGPHIVPAEEIADPQNLHFELRVNGVAYQKGCLSEMLFSIETLVSVASHIFDLAAGDVVTTGSPPGMFDYHLGPGDVIEAEIEQIGVLKNPVVFQGSGTAQRE